LGVVQRTQSIERQKGQKQEVISWMGGVLDS